MQFSVLATILVAVVSVLGGIVVALISRGGTKRAQSGNVNTADARTLFDTAGSLIDRLSVESVGLRARIDVYEKRIGECEERIRTLDDKLDELESVNKGLLERNRVLETKT